MNEQVLHKLKVLAEQNMMYHVLPAEPYAAILREVSEIL